MIILAERAIYIDISEQILTSIRSGEYAENVPLPSERVLCEKYHASRTTIRLAIQRLKNDDVVYTVQGRGTFIKPQVFTQSLMKFYSFTDTLKSSNILIKNEIISHEVIEADASISKRTGYPEGTSFHKLCRLRSASEYPLMLETTYLPKMRFVKLDLNALSNGSLYEFLRTKYGFQVDRANENFLPVLPRAEETALLQISSNSPCILLERFSYEDDLLIEYTKSIVRGDKYIFRTDLEIQPAL